MIAFLYACLKCMLIHSSAPFLFNHLVQTLQELKEYTSGAPEGTCLFLLSDGEDSSTENILEKTRAIRDDGITVDTIVFG